MHLLMYFYIYLQSPAAILSSDPPQPIDLLPAYLFIYVYIYMYMYVCIFIFILPDSCLEPVEIFQNARV